MELKLSLQYGLDVRFAHGDDLLLCVVQSDHTLIKNRAFKKKYHIGCIFVSCPGGVFSEKTIQDSNARFNVSCRDTIGFGGGCTSVTIGLAHCSTQGVVLAVLIGSD